ncbi:hypothetical protein L2E82_45995 [Cichorium intybus]|uniref:Uncharacterized protein n=1 Tax=Cichorium intybus TaxID=13427 RepID=A0ACB8ZV13_CICIN|nr:hypothetical protein L2E82_45995 [Cichorium intybus]
MLHIGHCNEVYKKNQNDILELEDRLSAFRYVPGGSVALLYASKELDNLAPVHTIVANAGVEGVVIVGKLPEQDNPDLGYDAAKGSSFLSKNSNDSTFISSEVVPRQDSTSISFEAVPRQDSTSITSEAIPCQDCTSISSETVPLQESPSISSEAVPRQDYVRGCSSSGTKPDPEGCK